MYIYEACVGSLEEAKLAETFGANRIELCDNLMEGGTTPSFGTIALAGQRLRIPFHVIIRPRGGNFVYSHDEMQVMKLDIAKCQELGVPGVVIGLLDQQHQIPLDGLRQLLEAAAALSVTFHMAFDEIADRKAALDLLAGVGIHRILTKGGPRSAPDNLNSLKELVAYAGDRIIIMPGGGVTKENRERIAGFTGAQELHGSKIVGDLKQQL